MAKAIKPDLILLDDLRCDPAEFFGRTEADATGLPEAGMPAGGENTSHRNVHVLGQPMSRRFPEFSRLFWQSLRPQPGLHPAMRARMWKPGQSGNPAGVSKAYAEAMSMRARELSLGAERTRRWRQRRQHGLVVVSFDVAPDITAELIRLGWLDATKRGDKEAIATALIELAGRATELEVTPASRSM